MALIQTSSAMAKALRGLHLFHYGASSCSQRVRMTLAEKRLPWESHIVDLRTGAQFAPDYRTIHPGAVVPALVHDGAVVIESIDIMVYIDQTFRTDDLAPADDGDPLLSAADRTQACVRTLTHEFVFRDREPPPSAEEVERRVARREEDAEAARFICLSAARNKEWLALVRDHTRALRREITSLETRLVARPWLGGDRFGLADIAWMSTINRLDELGWPWAHAPAVSNWLGQVRARPSYEDAVARFGAPTRPLPERRAALAALARDA